MKKCKVAIVKHSGRKVVVDGWRDDRWPGLVVHKSVDDEDVQDARYGWDVTQACTGLVLPVSCRTRAEAAKVALLCSVVHDFKNELPEDDEAIRRHCRQIFESARRGLL